MQVANFVIEPPGEAEEAPIDFSPVVVAEGSQPLKSLSVASAVAELDLSGAPLVVFQHAGSERVNIVYRRARRRDRLAGSALGRGMKPLGPS